MAAPDDDLDFLDNGEDEDYPDEDTQPDAMQLDETGTDPTEG